jgi:hypothetical protein
MTTALLMIGILLAASGQQPQWPTLRALLEANSIPGGGVDDLDRQIINYRVESDSTWFAIGYFWLSDFARGTLPPELRIRTFDRQRRRWASLVLHDDDPHIGTVEKIARHGRWVYVDTHLNPSAGGLLVLTADLKVRRKLYGWTEHILEDDRVVYHNSTVHFAPAHPGSLNLYDPRTDFDVPLYPSKPDPEGTGWMVDRSFTKIERLDGRQLALTVIEQRVKLNPDNAGAPDGPERVFHVTCDISTARPRCVSSR